MNRWLLRCSLLVAAMALATAATAQVNLSWDDCGTTGTPDKAFACNANTGAPFTLVGSFISPAAPQCVAIEIYMDMIESVPAQSPWWQLDNVNIPGACRGTSGYAWSADFLSGPFTCLDFWAGGASGGGGVVYNGFGFGPNTNRIKGVFAIPAEQPMAAGDEVYGFKFNILRAKTTGTGSCAGCANAACIVLNRITVNQPAGIGDFHLSGAAPGGRDFVTWQGGTGADCNTVPAQNRTWGQIKALYR